METRETLTPAQRRRNFRLGLLNGVVFNVANVFLDTDMVVAWFLTQLGAANLLIGLAGPLRQLCWLAPQMFVSGHMQRQRYKLPIYRSVSAVRVSAILAMAASIALIPTESPWLIAAFFAALIVYGLGTSLGSLSFMAMLDQVIPPQRRGRFFALRLFFGGIIALGASALVGYLIEEPRGLPFPLNFSVMFVLAAVSLVVALGAWSILKEPPNEAATERSVHWTEQFRRGVGLVRDDPHYRTFLIGRLALMGGQIAMPFYIVYAKEVLGISAGMVSVYLTVRTAASIASNLLWGRISDRHGNRLQIRITNLIGLSVPLLALATTAAHQTPSLTGTWLAHGYALLFVALGAFRAGSGLANSNYLLDLAPPGEQPLYLGFTNTISGLGMLASVFGGLVVDWAGFVPLMLLSAVSYGVAVFCSTQMIEPRHLQERVSIKMAETTA